MKKLIIILVLVFSFLSFAVFDYCRKSEKSILKIITPVVIQVDFNNNKIADEGETVCIPDVKSFSADITKFDDELAEKLNLSTKDAISLGYLSDDYAEKVLSNQRIKVKLTSKKSNDCKFANIFINKENYAEKLKNSGFGIVNSKPANKLNFDKHLNEAKKFNLVIFNHSSKKFHKLDCKYGLAAHDAVVIFQKQLPGDALPCKFCHLNKHNKIKTEKLTVPAYPQVISNGSIKFYLTDFTTQLKPDSKCSSNVCVELVKQINQANSTIDMAVYGYDDIPAVTNAIKSALNRGVRIRLVYDTNFDNYNYYEDTEKLAKIIPQSISDKSNSKMTSNMLMHNKFMIFDDQTVITGSMNFSKTGLSGFNGNTMILINSKEIAQQYTKEFDQMFSGKFHKTKIQNKHSSVKLGTSIVTPFFSPQDNIIKNNLIPLINKADKYIYMPTFIITHYDLTDALISAKKRGVDVKVIIDATNTSTCKNQLKKLRDSKVQVKTENYAGKMHSKSIIIDDKYIITGSMNFSKSGEVKNDENVLIIEDIRLAKFYKGFFDYTWKKIPERYLHNNVRSEGKFSIGSCSDGIDNNFDGKIDKDDVACK